MEKTLTYLNGKIWYRAIKVIYLLAHLINFGVLIDDMWPIYSGLYSQAHYYNGIKDFLSALIIIEIVKRIFYYIVIGRINPKK